MNISDDPKKLSVDQMLARYSTLSVAAEYLRLNAGRLPEAESVANDLLVEAQRWQSRAKRAQNVLTDAQRRTYNHLLDYLTLNGRSPTIVQLGKMDNVSSNTAGIRVLALIRKGYITKTRNAKAGLAVCDSQRKKSLPSP
jgi:hypothetical protein